jgi:hypothetical protein
MSNRIGKKGDFRSTRAITLWKRTKRSIFVKTLMVVTHGGDIWLDKLILVDVGLIAHITGLPSQGMDTTQCLDEKREEKALTEEMNKKYFTDRGIRGIIIKRINDVATQMAAKIMASKLLRKFRKEEVPTGVIIVATQCVEGTLSFEFVSR